MFIHNLGCHFLHPKISSFTFFWLLDWTIPNVKLHSGFYILLLPEWPIQKIKENIPERCGKQYWGAGSNSPNLFGPVWTQKYEPV